MALPIAAPIHLRSLNYNAEPGATLNLRVGHDIHITSAPAALRPQLRPCPASSPNYVSRPNIEARVKRYFFETKIDLHRLVLFGLGGSGKTDIASKFAHTYFYSLPPDSRRFSDLYYVDATTKETMTESLQNIAHAVAAGDAWSAALRFLENQAPSSNWLMIYDNADDPRIDLSEYLPKCARGNIIITTRNYEIRSYGIGAESNIEVSDMTSAEAVKVLLVQAGVEGLADSRMLAAAQHLAQELHYFALAVSQAGAYIRAKSISIDRYTKLFTTRRDSLHGQHSGRVQNADIHRHRSTHATWLISYEQLSPHSSLLLQLFGFMHNVGISDHFFEKAHNGIRRYSKPTIPLTKEQQTALTTITNLLNVFSSARKWDTLRFSSVIGELRSFSLISYDESYETYTIHPLVHKWARKLPHRTTNIQLCASLLLAASIPSGSSLEEYLYRKALLVHMVQTLHGLNIKLINFGSLDVFALVYRDAGKHDECAPFRLRALEIQREALGEEHPQTLVSMNNLALSYRSQGLFDKAEPLQVKTLDIQRRLLGEKHPHTLTSMNNLASIYMSQDRSSEAELLYAKVLDIQRTLFGDQHPHTLTSMSNLASAYRCQRRFDEAELLQVTALEIRRKVLGEEHPQTLVCMSKLALTYKDKDCLNKAEQLQTQVLEIQKKILGEEHPHTLTSLNNLAATLRDQGRSAEAVLLYAKVLEMQGRVLGEEHPDTLVSTNGLALTYKNLGCFGKAESLCTKALGSRNKVLGEDHPYTLSSRRLLQEIRAAMQLDPTVQSFNGVPPEMTIQFGGRKQGLGD